MKSCGSKWQKSGLIWSNWVKWSRLGDFHFLFLRAREREREGDKYTCWDSSPVTGLILPAPKIDKSIFFCKDIFWNLNKYIFQFKEICFAISTNTVCNLSKYIFPFKPNTLYNLERVRTCTRAETGSFYRLMIETNTFLNLYIYIFSFIQMHFAI